jgi:hypothetical protein
MSFTAYYDSICNWLEHTDLGGAMVHYAWLWAACETLHFAGLCLLVGVITLLDLRMLGVAKGLPIGEFHKLVPWGIAGFVINAITGSLFFIGAAHQYSHNIAFLFKMLFIAVGGINVLYFYGGGVFRRIEALGPEADAPRSAKVVSWTSIIVWLGAIYWGRMLPFIGDAF